MESAKIQRGPPVRYWQPVVEVAEKADATFRQLVPDEHHRAQPQAGPAIAVAAA